MTANLLEQRARELAAECDALRRERYNTPRWDPKPMQLLFYCAEILREVARVQAEAHPTFRLDLDDPHHRIVFATAREAQTAATILNTLPEREADIRNAVLEELSARYKAKSYREPGILTTYRDELRVASLSGAKPWVKEVGG